MKRPLLLLVSLFIFSLSQAQQPFITTWEVTAGDLDITIPANTAEYTYDYTVDFGDGTVLNNQTGNATHTYSSPGIYTVSISGTFPQFQGIQFSMETLFPFSERLKPQSVEQWGDIQWLDMSDSFYYFQNMEVNATDIPDLSNVTSMSRMFYENNNFDQNINNWDVSNITNMNLVFHRCNEFNQPLNNWNVSNVTEMLGMFQSCTNFNQPLDNWDVSNVITMTGMFTWAENFNQNLNSWDISGVTNISLMFYNADSFNQPLYNWDVSNVNAVYGYKEMFSGATAFNQNLSTWDFSGQNLDHFLDNTSMSTANYDGLITKLVELNYSDGLLGAENIKYCEPYLRQQLINTGWTVIDGGQASNCDFNYVTGNISYDFSIDGCDVNDYNLSNFTIHVFNESFDSVYEIDQNGNYIIPLDAGNYNLRLLNLDTNFTSTPQTQNINFSGQDEILDNIDFCITANQQFEDLSIDIFPLEDAIPGFETDYQIIVTNNGTQTVPNVQVSFGYDESFQTYVSSTMPISGSSTDILNFQLSNLVPFSQEVFEITMLNVVPPTLNGGEILTFTVQVTPDTNDVNIKDNISIYEQTVVNSFDPNDKMVVQGDEIEIDDTDQYLDYRIRFQNLGTANAINVKITDTIDNNLDWTTFQPITSSHDYRIEILDGEQINYYFDNINLPFETADPDGSNGYITYKIKPKPTVQIGDTFENTTYIYFDFNQPIITNTVVTTVVDNLDVNTFDLSRIDIYPNPVKDKLNINLPNNLQLHSIELFDIQGKQIKVFENQFELDFSAIQQGIYILRLGTNQGVYNHKVVKE